ncbi:cytochrome C oxidase subunit IV family protein [Nocardia wallacei]|uniref:cytochrome C oxidase subunit IV family protein n=1 Tax=Nocardia wallacei TaxID=480035 RepID=UPI0024558D75|nr:cytochrome C oxidase subunit IV family protein [Nocardia wallacei]
MVDTRTSTAARAITAVWIVLVVGTAGTWWLAPGHTSAAATGSVTITVAVLALAVIKSRLIIRYFMEVRSAPAWLRRTTDVWLAVLFAAVLVCYLV